MGKILAWSPASVMDHDFSLDFSVANFSFPQRMLTDPHLAGLATGLEIDVTVGFPPKINSRQDFFRQYGIRIPLISPDIRRRQNGLRLWANL